MSSVYDPDAFSARVSYAARCFKRGTQSRHFDTCFEMWDGEAVVTALVRKAQKDPELKRCIAKGWSATYPELPTQWLETAAQYADVPDRELRKLAARIRAQRETQ